MPREPYAAPYWKEVIMKYSLLLPTNSNQEHSVTPCSQGMSIRSLSMIWHAFVKHLGNLHY